MVYLTAFPCKQGKGKDTSLKQEAAAVEDQPAKDEDGDGIDPVMKQYMAMVQQQKEAEQKVSREPYYFNQSRLFQFSSVYSCDLCTCLLDAYMYKRRTGQITLWNLPVCSIQILVKYCSIAIKSYLVLH